MCTRSPNQKVAGLNTGLAGSKFHTPSTVPLSKYLTDARLKPLNGKASPGSETQEFSEVRLSLFITLLIVRTLTAMPLWPSYF